MNAEEKQKREAALFPNVREVEAAYHILSQSLPSGFKPTKIERAYARKNHFKPTPSFYCERQKSFPDYTYTVILEANCLCPLYGNIYFSQIHYNWRSQIERFSLAWFMEHVNIWNAEVFKFFEQALREISNELILRFVTQRKTLREPAITLSVKVLKALLENEKLAENLAAMKSAIQTAVPQLGSTRTAFGSKMVQQVREDLERACAEPVNKKGPTEERLHAYERK